MWLLPWLQAELRSADMQWWVCHVCEPGCTWMCQLYIEYNNYHIIMQISMNAKVATAVSITVWTPLVASDVNADVVFAWTETTWRVVVGLMHPCISCIPLIAGFVISALVIYSFLYICLNVHHMSVLPSILHRRGWMHRSSSLQP